jgi:hypothetical protein
VKVVGRLRQFFEKNVTGFTYLFFAQTIFFVENIYWRYQLAGSFGKTPIHSPAGWFNIFTLFFYYSFPLLFFLAAFLTFNYPKNRDARFFFSYITVLICLMIVASALLN